MILIDLWRPPDRLITTNPLIMHESPGVANLRCLKGLIERQTLPCHFGFYQLDFPTDCPVLVVSRSRSILGGGSLCQVPHSPPSDSPQAEPEPEPEAGAMDEEAFRRYLAAAAAKEVEIDAEIALRAEREFVGLRAGGGGAAGAEGEGQENKGQQEVTPETLGRWLTLCRLLCAVEGGGGNAKVGERHWERMRALEEERVGRLRALGLDPPAQ